jgi:hypothetical protein
MAALDTLYFDLKINDLTESQMKAIKSRLEKELGQGFDIGKNISSRTIQEKSLSTGGFSEFTVTNVLKILDFANGLKGCLKATELKDRILEGVGAFSNFIPNSEVGLLVSSSTAILTKSLTTAMFR